ncbi:MAG: hypothetical protein LPK03_02205, partial [Pontibacter sp.]|nr:hypothetical protein [Pontibacter sp.]
MDLILFSCRARVASFFRQKRLQRILFLALGLVSAGVYGWLFSYLLGQAGQGSVHQSVEQVLEYTNLFILA